MKTISFSAVEILPSLLDHSKTQTIQPIKVYEYYEGKPFITEKYPNPKTSRFKVGDQVQLLWKMRTSPKDSWFCSKCGVCYNMGIPREMEDCEIVGPVILNPCSQCKVKTTLFPKILGTVEITEVFQIEMSRDGTISEIIPERNGGLLLTMPQIHDFNDIWKRDVFKSAEDMFRYFDEHYDLSSPKTFEVRRWKWL
jgi:hypothetical protein